MSEPPSSPQLSTTLSNHSNSPPAPHPPKRTSKLVIRTRPPPPGRITKSVSSPISTNCTTKLVIRTRPPPPGRIIKSVSSPMSTNCLTANNNNRHCLPPPSRTRASSPVIWTDASGHPYTKRDCIYYSYFTLVYIYDMFVQSVGPRRAEFVEGGVRFPESILELDGVREESYGPYRELELLKARLRAEVAGMEEGEERKRKREELQVVEERWEKVCVLRLRVKWPIEMVEALEKRPDKVQLFEKAGMELPRTMADLDRLLREWHHYGLSWKRYV